jgi:hypothetical protein
MVRMFIAGLLARSQFASERSCDRPTRISSSVVSEQMLSWYQNSKLHCMLPKQTSQCQIGFYHNAVLQASKLINSVNMHYLY